MEIVETPCWEFPTEKIVWFFCFKLRENQLWHKICVFFLHTMVAYFADFVLICVGRATMYFVTVRSCLSFDNSFFQRCQELSATEQDDGLDLVFLDAQLVLRAG
jgi:hypothetical protein